MPRVTSKKFQYVDEDNVPASCNITLNVSVDGEFYARVPEVLEETLTAKYCHGIPNVTVKAFRYGDDKNSVFAPTLDALKSVFLKAFKDYSAPTVTRRLVIRYAVDTHYAAWQTLSGDLVPNGSYDRHPEGKSKRGVDIGDWVQNGTSSRDNSPYKIAVFARVQVETTTTRGASVTVKYNEGHPLWNYIAEIGGDKGAICKLNDYCSISHVTIFGRSDMDVKAVDYDEHTAAFFFDLLKNITKMAHMFNTFFGQESIDFKNVSVLKLGSG